MPLLFFSLVSLAGFGSAAFAEDVVVVDKRSVAACTTFQCLRDLLPRDRMTWLNEGACKPLAGKTDPAAFNEDLAVLCKLTIARARGSFRKRWPCSNEDNNTDWKMGIEGRLALRFFNESLYARLPKRVKPVDLLPTNFGANNSTIHHTYVYDRQFSVRTKSGTDQEISFATYFCITGAGEKRAYVPYFNVLKVDSEATYTELLDTPLFSEDPIFTQTGAWEFDRAKGLTLVDVNEDGLRDLLAVDNDMSKDSFAPRACLANSAGKPCTEVRAGHGLVFKEMFAHPSIKLVSPKLVEIHVTTTDSGPGLRVKASARFALQGADFVKQ